MSNLYRVIIKQILMTNNAEYVLFGDTKFEYKQLIGEKSIMGTQSYVVLCREVYDLEISEGLDISFRGERCEEKPPEITSLLDSYYRLSLVFDVYKEEEKALGIEIRPVKKIARYIGSNFYDCMSGGMDCYEISILKYLIEEYDLDLKTEVYPAKEKWHTLRDWLREIESMNLPDFKNVLFKIQTKLKEDNIPLLV